VWSEHPARCAVRQPIQDVEDECDGMLNYDRTKKLGPADERAVREANLRLIGRPRKGV
jgi:hypothetical protein